jgi:hypothetical protein
MPPLLAVLAVELLKGAAYTVGCMIVTAVLAPVLDEDS